MKFKEILEEVEESKEFKLWKKKNKKGYLSAIFITMDFEKSKGKQPIIDQKQVDYSSGQKMAIFHIIEEKGKRKIIVTEEGEEQIAVKKSKLAGKEIAPQKLDKLIIPKKISCDIDDIESQVKDEMSNKQIQNLNIVKIIAILQMHDKRLIWNLTTILTSLELLTMHIDVETGNLLYSDKKNVFECIKMLPGSRSNQN